MRARVGLQLEYWDGVPTVVAHVFPLDTEAALADEAARLLGSGTPAHRPTLCGERATPHWVPFIGYPCVAPVRPVRSCPVCAKLDDRPRLP